MVVEGATSSSPRGVLVPEDSFGQLDQSRLPMSLISPGPRSSDDDSKDPQVSGLLRSLWRVQGDSDSDGSLSDLGDHHEGVSNLGLGEDSRSLLKYLRAWRKRVARSRQRSMPGLLLQIELRLHDLLFF